MATQMVLVRVAVAKIIDYDRMEQVIRQTPVIQNNPDWRCQAWVRNALRCLAADGPILGTATLDWSTIEATARRYAQQKEDQGRSRLGTIGPWNPKRVPTWDLIENQETIP